ncbi:MAG: ABC transporter ATP-binding protein [Phycisphaerales bacterium]|nr:ABC transporter ATP-binding protein [Phycisphaerales bacterium]
MLRAVVDVSLVARPGTVTALVGPDGAGKTTLLRMITALITPDQGSIEVAGLNVVKSPAAVQAMVGYMPQRFGLYEDLTVEENLNLYADLHGVRPGDRAAIYEPLMKMTALAPFMHRLAGRLSGGMKQKLGLACTLVRTPELLVLDEPTVGVDPVSRRELWEIITRLVGDNGLTVLMSTPYLDEADRCDAALVLYEGRVISDGPPKAMRDLAAGRVFRVSPPVGQTPRYMQARLMAQPGIVDAVPEGGQVRCVTATGSQTVNPLANLMPQAAVPRFEDGFMITLPQKPHTDSSANAADHKTPPDKTPVHNSNKNQTSNPAASQDPVVEVHDLVRRFGEFIAVNHVSFTVRRREIFGLLGPNGAGKSTTFRMLCGLLPPTSGTLRVAGVDARRAGAAARQRLGYVAQKFSLYGHLTMAGNLAFFASAYGLHGRKRRERLAWAIEEFGLADYLQILSGAAPGGYKQRLAMACALLHEPELLFLDEPTSGVDPLARREFWQLINTLAECGVTVVVTTHFMEEAEYCDRLIILNNGRILAQGSPAEVRRHATAKGSQPPTMEDAFIAIVEASAAAAGGKA